MAPRNAAVIGAGIAGLLAARVLRDHFDTVTIYERDSLPTSPAPRPGVSQSKHAHGLVARGHEVFESLLPGISDDLGRMGVIPGDFNHDIDWYFGGKKFAAGRSGLASIPATRPTLEFAVRRRLADFDNIVFCDQTEVSGLRVHESTVFGLDLYCTRRSFAHSVETDFIVDCSGRSGTLSRWREGNGLHPIREETVGIGLGYTSARFRVPNDPFGDKIATIVANSPQAPRGCFFYRSPDSSDLVEISLTGMLGDHAPTDLGGFLEFVASLPVKSIHRALKDAELVSEPVRLTYPASRWHHYEEADEHLDGIVPLGDAICSLNPIYAQGMTVAALEVLSLRTQLEATQFDARTYLAECAAIVAQAWSVSAGADLAFPNTKGRRTLQTRIVNRYVALLQQAATRDPYLSNAFFEVAGLTRPPTSLMRPAVVARVLSATLTRPKRAPADVLTSPEDCNA